MSVMMDGARMHAPTENPAPGDSLGGRLDQPGVDGAPPAAPRPLEGDLEPLSPELALVDPELAAAARARLPDPAPPPSVSRPPALLEILQANARAHPEQIPDRHRGRRRRLLTIAVGGVAAAALAFVLVSVPADEPKPESREQAAATRPSVSVPRTEPAPPAPSTEAPPPPVAEEPPPQTFAWAPTTATAEYEFQLFRGSQRVYRTRVAEPRLELPRRWTQGGRTDALSPGEYTWYVWPISPKTGRPVRVATVRARLLVD